MSYLSQAQEPRRRVAAITGVAAIHAAIGLALMVGLTVTGFTPVTPPWDPFTVTPDTPKPPPTDPRPRDEAQETFVTAPDTPIDLVADDPLDDFVVIDSQRADQTLVVDPGPRIEPTVAPPLAPAFTPRGARPAGNVSRWITTEDYPNAELRRETEGIAAYRLIVGTNGHATACDVTRSTGSDGLDAATCRLLLRRARFEAATDETGASVVGTYTGTVKWEIPN